MTEINELLFSRLSLDHALEHLQFIVQFRLLLFVSLLEEIEDGVHVVNSTKTQIGEGDSSGIQQWHFFNHGILECLPELFGTTE